MTEDESFLFGGEGSDDPKRFINNPDLYRPELPTETFEEYADWLHGQSDGRIPRALIFDMGNGKCAYAHNLAFHWALKSSVIGNRRCEEGRWCYEGFDPTRVIIALAEWMDRGWEGKPTGWRREPYTGLRRNDDGDPESERYDP